MEGDAATRVRIALELFDVAEGMVRKRPRREHPQP
jgi:hypothetical protein